MAKITQIIEREYRITLYSMSGTIFQYALPNVIEANEIKYIFLLMICLSSLTVHILIIWHCWEKLDVQAFFWELASKRLHITEHLQD